MQGEEEIRVLLIDEDPHDVELMQRMLADGFSVEVINHLGSVMNYLREGYDIVILDLNLPDSQGYDTFEAVEKMSGEVPVIVLTHNSDVSLATRAMSHGAQDYLFKETINSEVMARSVRYAIERNKLVQEQKVIMRELQRSNAELQQFVYVASHDLQEPLRMVTSYLGLMERTFKQQLDPKAKEYIDHAVEGGNRMRELINDVLAYSRVDTQGKKLAPVDMNAVVSKLLTVMDGPIKENKAEVIVDPLLTILADESQMNRVMQNLIGNALKFHGSERPVIHISSSPGEREWTFSVKDNGIGIDSKNNTRIFEMFRRLHTSEQYEGTGIGLAICKKIVEGHGGRIWVESEPGKGATFFFTIPNMENRNGKRNRSP